MGGNLYICNRNCYCLYFTGFFQFPEIQMDKVNYLKPQMKVRTIEGECLMQDGSPSVETPFDPKDPTQDVFAREGDYDEDNNPVQRSLWDD